MTPFPFSDRLLMGLGQTAWSGGLFAGMVWLTGKVFPRLPHPVRGVLWWLVCARFVVGVMCAAFVEEPAFFIPIPSLWTAQTAPNTELLPTGFIPSTNRETAPPIRFPSKSGGSLSPSSMDAPNAAPLTLSQLLLGIWIAGFAFRAGLSGLHYARLRKYLGAARTVSGAETNVPARAFYEAAVHSARLMNRPNLPRLLLSPTPCDPLVTGWRRPTVLLSEADAVRLSADELALVLCHEMAHLRRGDLLWGIVPHLALHLFWFWPPAYWACREWSLACEASCDKEAASAAQTPPRVYGELLLKLGTSPHVTPFLPAIALPVSAHFHLLQRRLIMLSHSAPAPTTRRRRILTALGGGALLAATLPLALLPMRFAAAGDTPAYTKINGDTDKPWSGYPDGPRNLNFSSGLADWHQVKGNEADGYTIAVQNVNAPTVEPSAILRAASPTKNKEGFLVQYARPAAFRGKRVRFSGWVKTENAQSAGFWLRMDTPTWQQAWNQVDAPLSGNSDWVRLEYVFDVPSDAQGWAFGTNLQGNGTIWLHAPHFDIVDKTVAVSPPAFDSSPEGIRTFGQDFDNPTNLDFKSGLVGWWNDNPQHNAEKGYAIGLDADGGRVPGQKAAYLKSISTSPKSYGTLAQNTQAINLRGKRVRYSVSLKTENAQAAGFWMVVHAGENSTGYNRLSNPITGTTAWKKYETEIDIPRDATSISYGLDLTGTGKVWTDEVDFVVIGDAPNPKPAHATAPASANDNPRNKFSGVYWGDAPARPFNLDFEQKLTGWDKAAPRSDAPDYEAGVDVQAIRPGGKAAPAFLRAIKPSPQSYGTLLQGVQAGGFKNRRIRFSGFIKTSDVKKACLFLRMDTKHGVSAWNMGKHPVVGTNGWLRVEFVLDVPADAEGLAYGVSLDGPGTVWADGFSFENVSAHVPVTPEPGG